MNNFNDKKPMHYTTDSHHVNAHFVKPYVKKDGTFVSGSWRGGDGKIMTSSGYWASNPKHKNK